MKTWCDLKFWGSEEWEIVNKKLDAVEGRFCPGRESMFRALEEAPYEQVKVAIITQDPYPNPALADGLCLSIPHVFRAALSPSLITVFN